MLDRVQEKILESVLFGLQPIIKVLLRSGIGYREFNEMAKTAYVRVASTEFGKRGRPTNVSRIAVMTGLSRKEIKRIRDENEGRATNHVFEPGPVSRLLSLWHSYGPYLTDNNKPRELPFAGPEPSFSALVKLSGGDIAASAVCTELKRINALEELADGTLRVRKTAFVPDNLDEKVALCLETGLYPLASTIAHNCNPMLRDRGHFQRFASADGLDIKRFPEIREQFRDELRDFLVKLDGKLTAYETAQTEPSKTPRSQVGVGIYYFESAAVPDE